MTKVFVSHAGVDLALACEVRRWLIETGHHVFLDQHARDGIAVGEQWEQCLYEQLRWADAVVCVVTRAYLVSLWCTAELVYARFRGSLLLPLRAERDVSHPLLESTHHTDLVQDPSAARDALVEALRRVDAAGGTGWPDDRSPYPGLRPFDADLRAMFFGRDEDVKQLAGLLRSTAAENAGLLVVGPSGCGKSSLVRAGLLPMMADEPGWRILPPMLPGADPVGTLARKLAAAARRINLHWRVKHVRHRLNNGEITELADELLLADPSGPQQRLLIVVDQFEELLIQAGRTERAQFAELLRPASSSPVKVLGTLRPEFLGQLLLDPHLSKLPTQNYMLRPLRREALRTVIEKPAQLVGIDIDDGLVERLVDDTDSGEALPLLAFTLARLADGVSRGGRLSTVRYEDLGRVQGALTRQADAALAEAVAVCGRTNENVIAGLLRLVTFDEQGRPTRWRVNRDELPIHLVTELNSFVTRRLLTTDTDNGTAVIGVAHEAFLSSWPPLVEAIKTNASALRARRAVKHAAREWHEKGHPRERLWVGGQLAAAVADTGAHLGNGISSADASPRWRLARWLRQRHRVLVTDHVDLDKESRDFLHASIRADRYRRGRAATVLSVLLALALIGAGIAVIQQRTAQKQLRIATARQLVVQARVLLESDPRTALQLGLAAYTIHSDGETHASLVNNITTTPYRATLTGHTDSVFSVAFAPDGQVLATASKDGTVRLWDLTDRRSPKPLGPPLTGHTDSVFSVAFAPDGQVLATASKDGTVRLWDLTDRRSPKPLGPPLTGHTGPVVSMAVAPGGQTLATASDDTTTTTVILWDLTDRRRPQAVGPPLTVDTGPGASVAFTPDGQILVTAGGGTVRLWDLTDRRRPQPLDSPLTGQTDSVFSVAATPDGRVLATAGGDGTVRLWDLTDRRRPQPLGPPLPVDTGSVSSLTFAGGGQILVTASGGMVRLWDLTDRRRPQPLDSPLTGQTDSVFSVAATPDGQVLATAGADGTVRLWDLVDRRRPQPLDPPLTGHTGPVSSVVFAQGGQVMVTAGGGIVRLWDLVDRRRPQPLDSPLTGQTDSVFSVAATPDGQALVTAGAEGTVRLWDLADRRQPQPLNPPLSGHTGPVGSVALTQDGQVLATAGGGMVRLWDLTDRRRPQPLNPPLTDHTGRMKSMAFTPDGRTLVTAGTDGTARLWDLTDRRQPQPLNPPLTGHTGRVASVGLTPDGQTLATADANGAVRLWDLIGFNDLLGHTVQRACAITGGGFTPDEWPRYIPRLAYQNTCPS